MDFFPNRTGNSPENDDILHRELLAAGIESSLSTCPRNSPIGECLLKSSGEVKTAVMGQLEQWSFRRAWYYWDCSGPGIPPELAERLHETHGQVVRTDGYAGGISPRKWFKGFACGHYHVDTPEGLRALADLIKKIAADADPERGESGKREIYELKSYGASDSLWTEVSKEEWLRAERAAGFHPKLPSSDPDYMSVCATSGFSNSSVCGRIRHA